MITLCSQEFCTANIMHRSSARAVQQRGEPVHAKVDVQNDVDAARRTWNATAHADARATATGEWCLVVLVVDRLFNYGGE
jgi:hypothetical protein